MRLTVLGAGVMGTLYAARLAAAGHHVTVVARGARAEALLRTGLQLRRRGASEVLRIPVHERPANGATQACLARSVPAAGDTDAVLVFLRAQQVDAVLEALKASGADVVMMVNTASGYGEWSAALGPRLLAGFPGATGRFDADGTVEYELAPRLLQPTVLGEPHGGRTPRLVALAAALRSAGFPVQVRDDLERWIRTHAAWIAPFILTAAAAGSADQLASAPLVRRCVAATLEALRAVRAAGRLAPAPFRALPFLPAWLAVAAVRLVLWPSRALREHLFAAGAPLADEGRALAHALLRDAGRPLPALTALLDSAH